MFAYRTLGNTELAEHVTSLIRELADELFHP